MKQSDLGGGKGSGRRRGGAGFVLLAGMLSLCGCLMIPVARDADRDAQCRKDLRQAEGLRGLPLRHSVDIARETPDELRRALVRELDKPESRQFLGDTERLMRQFRLLEPSQALREIFLEMMVGQVAAYYDAETRRVAYIEGGPSAAVAAMAESPEAAVLLERFVYAHEFCHAIEDSHFDFERLTREALDSLDRNLALSSLVEGSAMLVGLDGALTGMPLNTATPLGHLMVQLLARADLSENLDELEGYPRFLTGALIRPYLDGAVFVNRLRREAGWEAVNQVYTQALPRTTAEILYPERRYLRGFEAACLAPEAGWWPSETAVATNSLGVLGIALWLAGDRMAQPRDAGFLKGWMGDRVWIAGPDSSGITENLWLSYWERPGQARAFARRAERRLAVTHADAGWAIRREGRLVAVVWSDEPSICLTRAGRRADAALAGALVNVERPSWLVSWWRDAPWPARFSSFPGHGSGFSLLGGYALDLHGGPAFFRFDVASGLAWRLENNPDRHYYALLGGLLRHVEDARSDFTFWKIPLVMAWHRRGSGEERAFRWRLLWGLLASGSEQQTRILGVRVQNRRPAEQPQTERDPSP